MDIRHHAEEHNDVGVLIHLEEKNANILEFKAVGKLFHFRGINADLIEGLNAVGELNFPLDPFGYVPPATLAKGCKCGNAALLPASDTDGKGKEHRVAERALQAGWLEKILELLLLSLGPKWP